MNGDALLVTVSWSIGILSLCSLIFAASAVSLRMRNERLRRRTERLEAEWQPRILAALSGEISPEEAGATVATRDGVLFLDYLLRFARRLQGGEMDQLVRMASPFHPAVVDALKTGTPSRRALAVEMLDLLGGPKSRDRIVDALDDPAPLVAMIAVRALTRRVGPRYLEPVLNRLDRFDNWSFRLLASVLAGIGPEAAPALREALGDPQRPSSVRSVCAEALKQLNDLRAAETAAEVVDREDEREVVAASLRLLAKLGVPGFADHVRRRVTAADFVIRAHAITALAALGGDGDAETLRAAFDDESSWVAIHAATGLRDTGRLTELRSLAASEHPRAELARQVLVEAW